MIASHDTGTASSLQNTLVNKILDKFDGLWATQEASILDQYNKYNVKYFDFRVHKVKNGWQVCHGAVNFKYVVPTIEKLCDNMKKTFPKAYFRIILEKGSKKDEKAFIEETECLEKVYKKLDWVVIKKGWKTLLPTKFKIVDYTCKINTISDVLKISKYKFSIKNWCEKNNPRITDEMIQDKHTVYFYDYVDIQNN